MKQAIIVALVCLNAALVVALVFGTGTQAADAQVIGGGTNYILITGDIREDYDAVYILDLGKRRLAAMRFDKSKGIAKGRLVPAGTRELLRDFERTDRSGR
ncbi:MAG: hypothetical protein SVV80_03590 [Planctomycetota bacterium]|nr:hypothetical protein [Planctomycetota bacterium]